MKEIKESEKIKQTLLSPYIEEVESVLKEEEIIEPVLSTGPNCL